jgi:tetratricopeptide (TPR) repeat protein
VYFQHVILCISFAFACLIQACQNTDRQSPAPFDTGSLALSEARNHYNTLYWQGQHSEAIPYAVEALRLGEEELGPDHPTTATLMYNLARLYRILGDYTKAEPLFRRSLAVREESLGPEHLDVAHSLENLAVLDKVQGNYAEAEQIYLRLLAIYEKAFGPESSGVAIRYSQLAALYKAQGDYAKAEQFFRRALEIEEKANGSESLGVAAELLSYASLLRETGQNKKAMEFEARAIAIRKNPTHRTVEWAPTYEDGFESYQRADYRAAFRNLKPLADDGDSRAAYQLAEMYDYALGVRQNYSEAFYYYYDAANIGHGEAQFKLAGRYDTGLGVGKNKLLALTWYMIALKNDSLSARSRMLSDREIRAFFSVHAMDKEWAQQIFGLATKLSDAWEPMRN